MTKVSMFIFFWLQGTRCDLLAFQLDIVHKLNVHNTFRRCVGWHLNVLCTFKLCPVSRVLALKFFNHSEVLDEVHLLIIVRSTQNPLQ